MNTRSATQPKTLWVAVAFLLAAASAQGQSAWVYADVYYDAATDNVVATTTTLVDYSTEYYYSPKVQVSLSGSDGSYAWWYCPVAGAGACTNGPYAFGDVTLSATPGVTYTVQGYHSVETYYYYYDVDPGCMWGCSQWYDALGYSTGVCSPACQADPFCYCIETTGGASARTYFPPMLLYLAYVANQALGDTSKQSSTPQATLSCTPSAVTRGSNVNCTVTGPGSTRVTNWSFSGGGGNVSGPSGVSSWGGTMVQTGAISAKAAGISLPPQNITVNPRPGWGTSPVVPQNETTTGYPIAGCTFVSPPPNTSATLGCSTYLMTYQTSIDRLLTIPSGPNQDFAYYTLDASYTQAFPWKMHPDVYYDTPFSLKQHGNCGYITLAQLRTNITWHESSNEPPSHYSLYKDALQMNNYGSYVEARVALPHESKLQFHATTAQQLQARGQSVYNWAGPQNEHLLRRVNLNQATGLSEGEVNYPDPYDRLCSQ
jgi:hypothetical protein